jgi:hypothetical protein
MGAERRVSSEGDGIPTGYMPVVYRP